MDEVAGLGLHLRGWSCLRIVRLELSRRQATYKTGTRNVDLSQRDTFLKFHHLLAQIFLDSNHPLVKERDCSKCYAGFTKHQTLVPPTLTLNYGCLQPFTGEVF